MHATALACAACGHTHPLDARYACDRCFGPLEPQYDTDALRASVSRERIEAGPRTLWRYADFLPASPPSGGLPVGLTPLLPAPRLAAALGLREVLVKVEGANPTHSFKDRVVSVASARAVELGFTALACASTGNLAGAVAAQAAALGLEAYVFIPPTSSVRRSSPPPCRARGCSRSTAPTTTSTASARELAYDRPWAFVNMNVRPYYAQGSKTLAYETAEQLGWRLPAQTVAPIASGSLYTKLDRGYRDLLETGLVDGDAPPAAFGAQAVGCSPVAQAWAAGTETVTPVRPDTIAKSLAIGAPADGENALRVASARPAARSPRSTTPRSSRPSASSRATTGIFTETAGGATSRRSPGWPAQGTLDPDGTTVVLHHGRRPEDARRGARPRGADRGRGRRGRHRGGARAARRRVRGDRRRSAPPPERERRARCRQLDCRCAAGR